MSNSILTVMVEFYDKWNIQIFVLLSLLLQTILIVFAPFRKRTGNVMVILLIWLAYLLADWVASFAVGLISNNQKYTRKSNDHADILAFWAPFLLIHLGGPDTVTAFALEDNALWLRHLVGLLNQVVTATIVFGQSPHGNKLRVPTVLLFVAGTIKYGERTCALFLANLNRFRKSMLRAPDPGPGYAEFMEAYSKRKEANLPTSIRMEMEDGVYIIHYKRDLDAIAEVEYAYHFFEIFKGLIVDLIFSFRERRESHMFFNQMTAEVSFKVLAIELNFIYGVLYTKVLVVHSIFGYIVRFISWCVVVAALSIFYSLDKNVFDKIDVGISYTLLFGAIGLDTIALFMLAFSDWTVASIQELSGKQILSEIRKEKKKLLGNNIWKGINICFLPLFRYFLHLKKINWGEDIESMSCLGRARRILFRRWYESLGTYNLIGYCLKERPKKNLTPSDYFGCMLIYVIEKFGLKDLYDRMKYVSKKPLTKKLWVFIFEELRKKSNHSEYVDNAKKIGSARGEWVLQNNEWHIDDHESSKLFRYIVDIDYDQSLILWHIATDLCYQKESHIYEDSNIRQESHEDSTNSCEFCKILSDYMLYLLIMQPTMMSPVAGFGQITFHDTCAEAKIFFERKGLSPRQYEDACIKILQVNTEVEPITVKGYKSKTVLFDACILAKELGKLEGQKRWGLMSQVWVELLSYAASHCRANTHAAQLSTGGELITFVWLLMAHFGMGHHFRSTGHGTSAILN